MKEKVNNLVLFDKVRTKSWSWLAAREEEEEGEQQHHQEERATKEPRGAHLPLLRTAPSPPSPPPPLRASRPRRTTQATYDKLLQEVPKYKMITPSILSDRLRINGSLARAAIRHLVDEGAIRPIVESHHQYIYTRATNA